MWSGVKAEADVKRRERSEAIHVGLRGPAVCVHVPRKTRKYNVKPFSTKAYKTVLRVQERRGVRGV